MSSDDQRISEPPAVTVTSDEPEEASDLLAVVDPGSPLLARPETLVSGLRYLQQRIPEFTQLSVVEKQAHVRPASLDPEFIEAGLQAAAVWRDTKLMVQRDGDELRQEQEEIRRWEHVIVELKAITAGVEAANLKRKHRLGSAILQIYRLIAIYLRGDRAEEAYIRPYYENMKRAYQRTQGFRKKRKKAEAAGS